MMANYSFAVSDLNAVLGFFQEKKFDDTNARSIAISFLTYARDKNKSVFELLDSINTKSGVQLTDTIIMILNETRNAHSVVGMQASRPYDNFELRNIVA